MADPIDTARSDGTNGELMTEGKTVNEFFYRRLVSPVMREWPQRMRFIEGAVIHDFFMDRTGRHIDKAVDLLLGRNFHQA